MLKSFRVKNLKAWSQQLWVDGVELAPITLLLGPNSAGKTSLLQVPLLLKQTFESPDRALDLNLGGQQGDLVDLGTAETVLHRGPGTDRELGLGISLRVGESTLGHRATYVVSGSTPVITNLTLTRDTHTFTASRRPKGGYLLGAAGYTARLAGQRLDARRTFQPERSLAFSAEAVAELGSAGPEVQDLALTIRQEISKIAYLGPLREPPERSYMWSGVEPGDLGKRGERAVHALLASDNTRRRSREGEEGGAQWLVERVSAWLKRLGVADRLVLERQGRSRHYELHVVRGTQTANIMDVGFGISQVLPMLVLAYFVPRGTTIVAEQPELHLHPRAQVGLAELMAEVARTREVQFLVETHSEHLFRRLQTLIANQTVAPDACRLYFVDRDSDGATQLTKLEVDGYGRVRNWPKEFFGDAMGETERQTRQMIERMKAGGPGVERG
jgi:predicted ATPase